MTMTAPAKAPAHQYSVALLITGDDLDPQAVTEMLKVEPAQTWKKGEDERPRSRTAGWEFRLEPADARFWKSMEEGLAAVLDRLEPHRESIRQLAARYKAVWWIGHFQNSLAGGPVLSPRILRRLADFDLALCCDTYFSPAEETHGDDDRDRAR